MPKYSVFIIIFLLFFGSIVTLRAQEILTWNDCLKEAAGNHPDLISAQENIKQYEASKEITKSSLLPQIDASLKGSTAKAVGETTDTYTYGASGTQLLFDGFKTQDELSAARENITAAEYNYKYTSSQVRFRLRSAFINLLKAQELLNITQQIYDIRRNNLVLIALRHESGLEHKGALLNAEANLDSAKFEITQAQRALEVAQRELIKEMGRREFSALRVEGSFEVNASALEKQDFQTLAKSNPYLEKLIAQKNAASFGIRSAKADFLPQLSAQAGANKSSSNWPPENDSWNAGLTLSFPIFEGGLRLAEVDKAQAVFNQAQAAERSARDELILGLEQAWAELRDKVEKVEVQGKFLESAQERVRIAEAQYSLGMIQFDNWIIIEDDFVRAKKALLDAQAEASLAEAGWIQAKGETLEYAN